MTIEEISVKFTADTNNLKRALSEITESLKGTEAQTLDIASAMDEITQPIKDMSKDIRSLVNQSETYNKRMSDLTKTVGSANRVISQTAADTQKTSKQSMSETTKMVQGWQKVKDKMLEVGKARPTFNRNTGTAQASGVSSRSAGESSQNPTQKALDSEQAKLQKLLNTLNEQQIKLDVINQKYDLSSQKLQKTESEIKSQQASLDGLKKDYETMSSVMSEMNINDSINEEMKRLRTTLEENKISFNELDAAKKRLEQSPYEIVDVGKSFMSMDAIIKKMDELDASSEDAWSKLERLETAMEGVSAKSRTFGSAQGMQRLNSVITQQENKLRSLQNAYNTASSQSATLSGQQEILKAKMQHTKESVQGAKEKITQLGEALQNTARKSSTGFFGRLASTVKNIGNATASLIHKFQNGEPHARKFGSRISDLGSRMSQTTRMVKSMVLSMLLMQLIGDMGENLQSFAKQSRVVNSDLSLLASSFTYLKSSILSAFQPLLSYITPILTSIVNTVADAFNKLAEFFAYLTGQTTFEKAVYTQKDYSASLDKSTKSAQALKNVLLGFDEITKLEDNSGSSGSGDGSGSLNTGNWETTKVDISSSLADAIKDSDWGAVGTAISNKLCSALESIDWNSVYAKAGAFGTNLATFLNGLITPTLFGDLGTTIAGALNTALSFLDSFGTTFDWSNFGTSIATAINNFFKNFDWKKAASALNAWVGGLKTAIKSALTGISWSTILKGGLDFLTELNLDTVSILIGAFLWKYGGKQIAAGVLKGLLNKQIALGIGKESVSVSTTIGLSVITAIVGFKIGNALYDHIPKVQEWSDSFAAWLFDGKDKVNVSKAITVALTALTLSIGTAQLISKLSGMLAEVVKNAVAANATTTAVTAAGNTVGSGILGAATKKLAGATLLVSGIGVNISTINEPTFGNTVISTLSTALGALMITGNPQAAICVGVASLGFKIGNTLYNNFDSVQSWADGIVETLGNALTGQHIDMNDDGELSDGSRTGTLTGKEFKSNVKLNVETTVNGVSDPEFKGMKKSLLDATPDRSPVVDVKTTTNGVADSNGKQIKRISNVFNSSFNGKKAYFDAITQANGRNMPTSKAFAKVANSYTASWKGKTVSYKINTTKKDKIKNAATKNKAAWTGKNVTYGTYTAVNGVGGSAKTVESTSNSMKSYFTGKTVLYNVTTQSDSTLQSIGQNVSKQIYAGMSKNAIKLAVRSGPDPLKGAMNGVYSFTPAYATGGFPEDGLFMANHGELVGKFSNGKTAVANNAQIVEGIEAGVYRAVTAANSSSGRSGGSSPVINVYVGGKEVTDVVVKDINDRTIQTGKNPLLV